MKIISSKTWRLEMSPGVDFAVVSPSALIMPIMDPRGLGDY